ncbi:hypothetical protein T07_10472 [Trichinella nelsoni]|uniref:Uncharacterized protein n=1 Tax=Trichinella nelsoni TaxID=6336 RepID=A0A0V0RIE6_9BILA|nr:hypothetical protein T07_10472 [Trichinella nelsoni]
MKDKQLLSRWENLKGPIPAPAASHQELQLTAQLPVSVGISGPDGCTLCAAPGPTLENARQPAVSTRQAAGDGKMREGLPGSFPHAHLNGWLMWLPNLWTVCHGSLSISKLEQKWLALHIQYLSLRFVLFNV